MAKTELGARIALAKTNEKRANKLAQMIDIREKGIVLTTEQEMYNLYIDRDEAYHVMKCLWSDVFNMLETKWKAHGEVLYYISFIEHKQRKYYATCKTPWECLALIKALHASDTPSARLEII